MGASSVALRGFGNDVVGLIELQATAARIRELAQGHCHCVLRSALLRPSLPACRGVSCLPRPGDSPRMGHAYCRAHYRGFRRHHRGKPARRSLGALPRPREEVVRNLRGFVRFSRAEGCSRCGCDRRERRHWLRPLSVRHSDQCPFAKRSQAESPPYPTPRPADWFLHASFTWAGQGLIPPLTSTGEGTTRLIGGGGTLAQPPALAPRVESSASPGDRERLRADLKTRFLPKASRPDRSRESTGRGVHFLNVANALSAARRSLDEPPTRLGVACFVAGALAFVGTSLERDPLPVGHDGIVHQVVANGRFYGGILRTAC